MGGRGDRRRVVLLLLKSRNLFQRFSIYFYTVKLKNEKKKKGAFLFFVIDFRKCGDSTGVLLFLFCRGRRVECRASCASSCAARRCRIALRIFGWHVFFFG